jgi:hypothetical protein
MIAQQTKQAELVDMERLSAHYMKSIREFFNQAKSMFARDDGTIGFRAYTINEIAKNVHLDLGTTRILLGRLHQESGDLIWRKRWVDHPETGDPMRWNFEYSLLGELSEPERSKVREGDHNDWRLGLGLGANK